MHGNLQLLEDLEAVMFHDVPWHIGDWIGSTLGMSLEHEGAYFRFLMRLYQRGKPLPDDDRIMATIMGLSVRVWKRLKDVMVSTGKIIVRAGCLTNSRFEKERRARADRIRQQAANAAARWSKGKTSTKLAPNLDETPPKVRGNEVEKPSKINDAADAVAMPTSSLFPLPPKEDVSNETSPSTASQSDRPGRGEALVLTPPAEGKAKRKKRSAVPEVYPEDFGFFWEKYPRAVGKADALRAWEELTLDQKRRAYRALKQQLATLTAKTKDPRGNYCPHPATWIRQGRFDDDVEIAAAPPPPPAKPRFQTDEDRDAAYIERLMAREGLAV